MTVRNATVPGAILNAWQPMKKPLRYISGGFSGFLASGKQINLLAICWQSESFNGDNNLLYQLEGQEK